MVVDVGRFARMLVARNILKADGRDAVSHTKFSMIYAGQNPLGGFINLMWVLTFFCPFTSGRHNSELTLSQPTGNRGGQINNSLLALPSFFSKNGFKSPLSPNNTPLAFGLGREGVPYWDIMKEDPATLATFHAVMAAQEKKLSDRGVYDYSWILQRKDDGALVVDVGGSRGHVLKQTMEETPGLEREAGRLVLQDRAEVIEEAKKNADGALKEIKMMEHDFFTEQPVKGTSSPRVAHLFASPLSNPIIIRLPGASIYYLRRILHDWSDDQSRVILSHLADAMSPDSRVLISENIVQEDPPTDLSAMMDMVMMTISGKERSERDWEDLVQKSGLRVVKIWRKQGVEMGIVECAKA